MVISILFFNRIDVKKVCVYIYNINPVFNYRNEKLGLPIDHTGLQSVGSNCPLVAENILSHSKQSETVCQLFINCTSLSSSHNRNDEFWSSFIESFGSKVQWVLRNQSIRKSSYKHVLTVMIRLDVVIGTKG